MKKLFCTLVLFSLSTSSAFASINFGANRLSESLQGRAIAATVKCSSYMYGNDGKDVYMRLGTHMYGPFASEDALKQTFTRLGSDFTSAVATYIEADPDENAVKEMVKIDDITKCLPYKMTQAQFRSLSARITKLFRATHAKYSKSYATEKAAFDAFAKKVEATLAKATNENAKAQLQYTRDRVTSHLWYLDEMVRTQKYAK